MGDKHQNWVSAALRVTFDESEARLVEEVLRKIAGDRFKKRNRKTTDGQGLKYLWILDSGLPPSRTLQDHVDELLSLIESNERLLEGIAGKCTLDIFCGFSSDSGQGGLVVTALSLRRMGALGVDLILDLYQLTDER